METDEADHSELEAKKLAYYLFWNVKADLSREYLVTDDFKDFVLEEDVEEAFNMIDDNRDGSVTLQVLLTYIITSVYLILFLYWADDY